MSNFLLRIGNGIAGAMGSDRPRAQTGNLRKNLGIDATVLAEKFLSEQSRGFLRRDEFNFFWEAMVDESGNLEQYILVLLIHLLHILKGKQRPVFEAQVIVNTIAFLVYRHPSVANNEIKAQLRKWNGNRQKYNYSELPSAQHLLNLLYKRWVERDETDLHSMVIQCHNMHDHQEIPKISNYYQYPTVIDVQGRSSKLGEKTCTWYFLKSVANSNNEARAKILNFTIAKFRAISGQVAVDPKLAEITLLALLFILKNLISYNRIPDETFIDSAIRILRTFYSWPVPYGSVALDLLLSLRDEKMAPGISYLRRYWGECRSPEITEMFEGETRTYRPLYYIFDREDGRSAMVAGIMKVEMDEIEDEYSVNSGVSARDSALLLLNIIDRDVGVSPDLLTAVRKLNEREIILFYRRATEILLEAAKCDTPQVALRSRVDALRALAQETIDHAAEKVDDMDDQINLEHFPEEYFPGLPNIHHIGLQCSLDDSLPTKGQIAVNERYYPVNEVVERLSNMIENLQEQPRTEDSKIALRFVIAGGNATLNAVVCAYATIHRDFPQWLEKFDLNFYIVPYSPNTLADWIARLDSWYNRHVYIPLQSRMFVVPTLHPRDQTLRKKASSKPNSVGMFYRDMTEAFVHEGTSSAEILLWECHGWGDGPSTQTPACVIPVCQRVVIGYEAELAGHSIIGDEHKDEEDAEMAAVEQKEQAPPGAEGDDANFLYMPVPIDLKWVPCNMIGNELPEREDNEILIQRLSIGSVPRFNDQGVPPNPMRNVLEMHATLLDQTRQRQKTSILAGEPNQHCRSVTVSTTARDDRFWIQADDKTYGPFNRVRLVPMVHRDDEQVRFPIRTFFPLVLS